MDKKAWFIGLTFISVIACSIASPTDLPTQIPTPQPPIASVPPAPTPEPVSTMAEFGESIYNEDIPATHAERIVISEIYLMHEALQILMRKGWDGNPYEPLPLNVSEFDQQHLAAYIADEAHDEAILTIPPELEPLYISPEATAEISALLVQARNEYVDYLASKGALPLYLDEINRHVLPPDPQRLIYYPINDPNLPAAFTEGLEVGGGRDYSQLVMHVHPLDIYLSALLLRRSMILGEEPAAEPERLAYEHRLRDMGLRATVYHEMTHVLQRAYINTHVPEEDRTSKAAWISAWKTLINVDTQYHWRWGDYMADSNNRHVSDESQAEGIAFEVLVAHYNMSPQQQAAVWDHLFGRLEDSRAVLDECRDIFERHFPNYWPSEFGSNLVPVMEEYRSPGRNELVGIVLRLTSLPSAVGYLHPMLPQDTEKVWATLQEP